MILVKIYWNTEADGSPVDLSTDIEDGPICYFGPFDTLADAVSWMENDYPDGDTDIREIIADDFKLEDGVWINSPDSIFSNPNPEQ